MLVKPFSSNGLFRFGDFEFDSDEYVLCRNGNRISLTPKMFEVLNVLVEHRGRVVSKNDLMKAVWADSFVEEGNLAVTIRQLRKTLGDDAHHPKYIETVQRRGYRFIADVERVSQQKIHHSNGKDNGNVNYSQPKHQPVVAAFANWHHELHTAEPPKADTNGTAKLKLSPPAPEAPRRRRTSRSVLLGLAAAIVLSTAGYGVYRTVTGIERTAASNQVRLKTNGGLTIAAVAPSGKSIVFAQKEDHGESLWLRQIDSGSQSQLLPADEVNFIGLTVSPDNNYAYYTVFSENAAVPTLSRIPLSGGPPEPLHGVTTDVSVSFTHDGTKFAFTESLTSVNETYLKVADADGSNQRTLITAKGENRVFPFFRASPVAWSPDGKTIACSVRETDETGSFYKIILVDANNGSEKYLSDRRWNSVENIVWRDAEHLALIERGGDSPPEQIWEVSRKTGVATQLTEGLTGYEWLSSANGNIFTIQKNHFSSVHVAELNENTKTLDSKQIFSEFGVIENVLWTSDEKLLYNSWTDGRNEIWRLNSDGTAPQQLTANSDLVNSFAVSPSDNSLVFSTRKNGKISLAAADPSGQNIRSLTNDVLDTAPSFAPDGKTVVFQRGNLKPMLWRVAMESGQEAEQLTGYLSMRPIISPDGKMIAYHFMDYGGKNARWKLGLVSSDDRRLLKKLEFPLTVTERKMAWHPTRNLLTLLFSNGKVLLMSGDDGKFETLDTNASGKITSFAWSPDGTRFAFAQTFETNDVVSIGVL